jgi:integrase
LGALSVDAIRHLVSELAEAVEAGDLAVKTVNNALGTLVVCLNDAVEDGLIATNPALRVQRLPPAHIERDYLRLDEIPRYLDACSEVYRPLAELLIGSGLRISEALGLRLGDLEVDATGGMIVVYRSRKKDALGSTKSDRFRSVEIGPGLCAVLQDQVAPHEINRPVRRRHGVRRAQILTEHRPRVSVGVAHPKPALERVLDRVEVCRWQATAPGVPASRGTHDDAAGDARGTRRRAATRSCRSLRVRPNRPP